MSTLQSRISSVLPWATWAFMLLAGLLFVAHYGSNVPSWDDWDMVPTLTHNQPITWDWLWSQHNEHRVPVPRLVFLGLTRLTTLDFRVPMFFNLFLMAALSAAMIVVARRLRGSPSLSDVFFPLAALNVGQAANLLWGWQIQFFLSVIFACMALLAILLTGTSASPAIAGSVAGVATILLVGCGANGVGLVPALALWPLALALLPPGNGGVRGRWSARWLIVLSLVALLAAGLYFVGWERVPFHPRSGSLRQTVKTAVQFLTIGLGPAMRSFFPWSGLITLLLLGITVLRLGWIGVRYRAQLGRSLGLLLFMAAMGALALGLGLGRDGFETRYVTLAVPAWCCAYFAWNLYETPISRRVRAGLAVVILALMWGNATFGVDYAEKLREGLGRFESDMSAGVPAHELIRRYNSWLHPHHDIPARYLPMLHRAGVGPFRALTEDGPFQAIPVDLHPAAVEQVHWRDSTAEVLGPGPRILFELPADQYVAGIRLGYQHWSSNGTLPYVAIRWKPKASPDFGDRFYKFSPTGDHANWRRGTWDRINDPATSLTVWISDTVGEIEILPYTYPATFHVTELSLLLATE